VTSKRGIWRKSRKFRRALTDNENLSIVKKISSQKKKKEEIDLIRLWGIQKVGGGEKRGDTCLSAHRENLEPGN